MSRHPMTQAEIEDCDCIYYACCGKGRDENGHHECCSKSTANVNCIPETVEEIEAELGAAWTYSDLFCEHEYQWRQWIVPDEVTKIVTFIHDTDRKLAAQAALKWAREQKGK